MDTGVTSTPPVPPEEGAIKNAAIRWKAILHNREAESTPEQQRAWDDRIMTAEVAIERALLDAGKMSENDAVTLITLRGRQVLVYLESNDSNPIRIDL
jgi:hypothetical protein